MAAAYEASFDFEPTDWVTLAPVLSLSAAFNEISSWTESGASATLRYDRQKAFSAQAGVGGRAEFSLGNPFGAEERVRFGVSALLTRDFGDRDGDVDAAFTDGGASFRMKYDEPGAGALRLGATLSAPLRDDVSAFAGVSTELREDYSGVNANVGVRIGW